MSTFLHALRHPLRLALALLAVVTLVGSAAGGVPLFAAVLGTLFGVPFGELLGRSSLRLPAALGGLALMAGLAWLTTGLCVGVGATVLGPSWSLLAGDLVGYSAATFCGLASLRLLALRSAVFATVEVAVLGLAFALAFAAHREGSIARPLWLSDRAWRMGYDPGEVLLVLGGLFGVGLATLLTLESKRRLSIFAGALVAVVALILAMVVDPSALQRPPPPAEMAEILEAMGEPPPPQPPQDGSRDQAQGPEKDEGRGDKPQQDDQDGSGQEGDEGPEPQVSEGEQGEQNGQPQDGQKPQGGQPQDQGEQNDQGQQDQQQEDKQGQGSDEEDKGQQPPPKPPNMDNPGGGSGKSSPVAVVVFQDDYSPPSELYYLRQDAHSAFMGARLGPAPADGPDQDLIREVVTRPVQPQAPASSDGRVAVTGTVNLLVAHDQVFAPESVISMEPTFNPNPTRFVSAYKFTSLAQGTDYEDLLDRPVGDPSWSPETWAYYTKSPEDPRYAELAQRILKEQEGDTSSPFRQALAVKLWLDNSMKYSRKSRHAGVADPTADFLFGDLIGYCVHSAHAAVFLWRSLGIPARIGVGYAVEESERRGASLVVMGRTAHAWPELYMEGLGWTVLDISPAENLDPSGEPMDEDQAKLLAEMAQAKPKEVEAKQRTNWRALGREFAAALGISLLAMVLWGLLMLYGVKIWRRLVPLFASARSASTVSYRTALDILGEVGLARASGETRERHAQRVAQLAPSFTALTELHLSVALGDPSRKPTERPEVSPQAWRENLSKFRAELRDAVHWRRRWLGLLNPISFLWSR